MANTVFITGASSGIGRATAKQFLAQGYNVVATMRNPQNEKEFTNSTNMLVQAMDVEDEASINNAVKEAINKFGSIDVLVNNAGYAVVGVFESSNPQQVKKQFEVNVFGLMNVTRKVLPHMRANGKGVIVNLSSYGGLVALPMGSLYNSTKFAVEGLSESLAHELSGLNIAVKLIEPGAIATNFRSNIDLINSDIPGYEKLTTTFWQKHAALTENLPKASAEDVANVIYTAATDNSRQLRYTAGKDAEFFINRKFSSNEAEYFTALHEYFNS